MATLTTEQRIAAWFQAFKAISAELTPEATRAVTRAVLATMETAKDAGSFQSVMSLAQSIMRNDRTAALAAAMITSSGIRPVAIEGDDQ